MSLAHFIVKHPEPILREFVEFARTHAAAGERMDDEALRDHAQQMLETIARDMSQPQTEAEEQLKSRGDAPAEDDAPLTAAERHGTDRVESGFTLAEMFAEYRALRASVLRNWMNSRKDLPAKDLPELIRFNEAIDQALAESITRYSLGIERSREKCFWPSSAMTCEALSALSWPPPDSWWRRPASRAAVSPWRSGSRAAATAWRR